MPLHLPTYVQKLMRLSHAYSGRKSVQISLHRCSLQHLFIHPMIYRVLLLTQKLGNSLSVPVMISQLHLVLWEWVYVYYQSNSILKSVAQHQIGSHFNEFDTLIVALCSQTFVWHSVLHLPTHL